MKEVESLIEESKKAIADNESDRSDGDDSENEDDSSESGHSH